MKIENIIIAGITEVFVHWSESGVVNDELGCDENFEINKAVSIEKFEEVAAKAAEAVESGYDKTKVDVRFNDGSVMNLRLDITKTEKSLIELIKLYIN